MYATLVVRSPSVGIPNMIAFPMIPGMLPPPTQDKFPVPSVPNKYPAVPPSICTLVTLPNATLAVFAKLTVPIDVKLVRLPTLVKLLEAISEFNVVPDKFAALAVIVTLLAAVNWPCWLTVNVATVSPPPYEPTVTAVLDILNSVPFNVKPVPAVYEPAPENWTNIIGVVPIVTGEFVVQTQPVSALIVPCSTKVNAPGISPLGEPLSKSVVRVNTKTELTLPGSVTT